jgi:glycosyltransferase involved in cell wall biosynthesis
MSSLNPTTGDRAVARTGDHAAVPTRTRPDMVVVVPHLGAGGTQRVVTLLLNHWSARGVRIALLTLFPNPDVYTLAADVHRESFVRATPGATRAGGLRQVNYQVDAALERLRSDGAPWRARLGATALAGFRAARAALVSAIAAVSPGAVERIIAGSRQVVWLRERIQALEPGAILSFLGATNIQTILAARGLGIPVLISERNDPAVQRLDEPWETLRSRIYPQAAWVTANSAGALETLARHVPREKLRQVQNPLAVPPCPPEVARHGQRLILVARLVEQKGVDLLIDAFARVAERLPRWRLDLVGDGPLRATLESQVRRAGIADRVTFHGHQIDPFPFLYAASVFVLPSRFEGMPNAMLEAMGAGLAIIVSDASPGPLELIRDGATGLVFRSEDSAALAAAILRVCSDPALRERLAAAAEQRASAVALPRVATEWERLLREAGVSLAFRADEAVGA